MDNCMVHEDIDIKYGKTKSRQIMIDESKNVLISLVKKIMKMFFLIKQLRFIIQAKNFQQPLR